MKVLIPLPSRGFDPTESAVPWKKIRSAGHPVSFATPDGKPAEADERMVTGRDLPVLFRKSLRAEAPAVALYREMEASEEFRNPVAYPEVRAGEFGALLLPGGHAKGMRPYLESEPLQRVVAHFFDRGKPVGAICHGTLLAARSRSLEDPAREGRSVLWGRRTTGLTRRQELIAWWLTRWTLGDYYRTYPRLMAEELISFLRAPEDYSAGPGFPIPLRRDSDADPGPGFTVRDGNYLSARWPGDAYRFGREFVSMLEGADSTRL